MLSDADTPQKKLEPEPEENDHYQREDRRYQSGDHPKTVWAAAERNAADVRTPNAFDQRCWQEYH